jgi:hypothetical protein
MTFSALFGLRIEATPMFGQPLSERSVFHRSSPVFALATQPTCPDSKEATPETTSNRRGYRADGPFSIPQTHRCSERNPRTSAIEASFSALAENEDWLANNCDKIIHSQGIPPQDGDAEKRTARETVAEDILRCLGAAVIMQWNTIPTKLQRELFDTAGSMGDALKSAALRAQIARFLHKHKDEESVADRVSKPNMTKGMPRGT